MPSMHLQFHSTISHLQTLAPGMNVNQVHGFNLNFRSIGDANSAQNQAIRVRNVYSYASIHEPQVLFYKQFHFN